MGSDLLVTLLRIRAALLWALFLLIVLAGALHDREPSRPGAVPAVFKTTD